ncbi:MAG: FMN-binding glutamate synthase family protein [Clostridia bacterium]|nr:MAG: FMN-binding glutamate synthase family protein [Clostridia bacterium]
MPQEFYRGLLTGGLLSVLGLSLAGSKVIDKLSDILLQRIMTEPYFRNPWELVYALHRTSPQTTVETNLRSQYGKVIDRPLSGPRKFPSLDGLVFNPAQLARPASPADTAVNLKVVIGPRAARPMVIDIPIMVSAMAYGLALSARAKIAIAKATARAGTATNTGEGPFVPAERTSARHIILQWNRYWWNKEPEILKQADMIEIQFGQGARGGAGHVTGFKAIDPRIRKELGLAPGQDAVAHSRPPGAENPRNLARLVAHLREVTGGVPIGVKLAAGQDLEKDLCLAVDAGVDAVAIDGAEAGTKGSPPVLQDEFGLPTFYAVSRAGKFWNKNHLHGQVSLIVGGGLTTPGDFLKVLALGADTVYIGSIALFALAHTQVLKVLPWKPPVSIVFQDSPEHKRLRVNQAATSLANFLNSCALEMAEGIKALGKSSVTEVTRHDLVALDPTTAAAAGVPLAYRTP